MVYFSDKFSTSDPNPNCKVHLNLSCNAGCICCSIFIECLTTVFTVSLCINFVKDIDQLKKTMALTGTPGPALLEKITSEEVVHDIITRKQKN